MWYPIFILVIILLVGYIMHQNRVIDYYVDSVNEEYARGAKYQHHIHKQNNKLRELGVEPEEFNPWRDE